MDTSNIYAYIRVSSHEQNEERQLIAMRQLHIPEDHIFMDKQSGKDFNRPSYKTLVNTLKDIDGIAVVTESVSIL